MVDADLDLMRKEQHIRQGGLGNELPRIGSEQKFSKQYYHPEFFRSPICLPKLQ
jgi:hypothetical protein